MRDSAFSHKIYYIKKFEEIQNLEGHPNCITSSRVTAILLNGWILPIGGASAVEGLLSTELPRLVFLTAVISFTVLFFTDFINILVFHLSLYLHKPVWLNSYIVVL